MIWRIALDLEIFLCTFAPWRENSTKPKNNSRKAQSREEN